MALSKSVNLAHAQTAVPCNVCEDEAPGEYYCIECKHTLCPPCEEYHRKFNKGHNVVQRTQVGDIDITVLTCTDHGDQASFHCEKCNIPVCGKCITGQHKGHDITGLNDIFEKEKGALQNHLTRMQQDVLPTLEKRKDEILRSKENYERQIEEITEDMEKENQTLHKDLDRIHEDRMERIINTGKSHLSTFDGCTSEIEEKIEFVKGRISKYREVIENNSLPLILNLAKQEKSLPVIESQLHLPQPPSFVHGNTKKLEENVGKLKISSFSEVRSLKLTSTKIVSEFKSPLKSYSPICITKEGDVWLGGDECRELVMVDIGGNVLRSRKIQHRPKNLAVMEYGDIIISPHGDDSRSVSRLLANGREQHVCDSSPSRSYGVSVTADQRILICTFDGRVMSTNGNGNNIQQIYKGSGEGSTMNAVESAEGKIYISDCRNSAVVVISKSGKVLSTITQSINGKELIWPLALVEDKIGNILLSDRDSHSVYIIDQNLQMTELVGSSHGIVHPLRLAVDSDNNLWIAQRMRNIHVVKYLV